MEILVFLLYAMRRVDCRRCGVVAVKEVLWGDGKRTLTKAYILFLARWARRLSWKETAEAFRTSWDISGQMSIGELALIPDARPSTASVSALACGRPSGHERIAC